MTKALDRAKKIAGIYDLSSQDIIDLAHIVDRLKNDTDNINSNLKKVDSRLDSIDILFSKKQNMMESKIEELFRQRKEQFDSSYRQSLTTIKNMLESGEKVVGEVIEKIKKLGKSYLFEIKKLLIDNPDIEDEVKGIVTTSATLDPVSPFFDINIPLKQRFDEFESRPTPEFYENN